ncbi:MAG: MFS transporter, partial [Lachnospiraceae bacterium]|nr:MFS transporter [Lachnospiraceae bacterium]
LVSAATAALACLPICLVEGNYPMFFHGRAMQGVAAGYIGVVVPMYLAECLDANSRGKGAGMFQLLDFIGITFCSIVGLVVVHTIGAAEDATVSVARKSLAWKTIFWSSAVPAVLFFLGALGLRITSLFYFPLGVIYVVRGVLTGVGDAFFALFNGIIEVLGRFIVPVTLTTLLGLGVKGIWLSTGIVWAISGITAWMRYYSRLHDKKTTDKDGFISRITRIRRKKLLSH